MLLTLKAKSSYYESKYNDRTKPAAGAVFAINMLVGTEAGDCFTEQEVTEMFTKAGFKNISRLEFESGSSQMTAQK